jgi:hypothetical protein
MYIPLWIIVIGVVVYFFWTKNKKERTDNGKKMSAPLSDKKTSSNPLFSEKEISDAEKLFTNWRKEFEDSFSAFQKKEVEEIKSFQGKKEDFKPSKNLLNAIGRNTLARFCTNFSKNAHEKMIESNIAIINGKEIAIVEKEFYSKTRSSTPYHNLSIIADWQIYEREIGKEYKEDEEQRKDYWNSAWNSIRHEED